MGREGSRSDARRLAVLVSALTALVTAVVFLSMLSTASAARAPGANFIGQPLGVLHDRSGGGGKLAQSGLMGSLSSMERLGITTVTCPQPKPDPGCNMTYHNGPLVIGPHTAYVVYWEPTGSTVDSQYHTLINRYLTDVAADSGRATNVYATDTQYDDSTNTLIKYQVTFGGSFTDTTAFPATKSGCPLTDGTRTVGNCLTETQESTELDNYIQANSLPRGLNVIYFLVLPQSVETCYDDFSNCGNLLHLDNRYCAYHSSFNISGHGQTLWANEPYINTGIGHCDSNNRSTPNGDKDAEAAINALSHEHNETMTDPTGGGWFDVDGTGENGDKCNFTYGPAIASNSNGAYNQLINKNPYEIQQEWSNAITGCASNYGAVDPTASFTYSPASPKALDSVSFDGTGSHSNNSGGYIIDYAWTFGDGGTGSGASPSHTYATSGSYTVKLTVKDDAGLTDTTTQTVTVVTRPTVTTYTGDTSGDYHDSVTLSAHLEDDATSAALSGKSINFTLGTQSCSDSTDGSGDASCSITLNQIPGSGYTVKAEFAGDSVYTGSSDSKSFTIEKEETTVTYTGPTVILASAGSLTVTAQLVEDGANDDDSDGGSPAPDPSGQKITFTLGSQSCSGTTDTSGVATCTIGSVSGSTLGSKTLSTSFSGDDYYLGSTDSDSVIVFAFASRGAFTLGNNTVAAAGPDTKVYWWSDNWWSLNSLSGGPAPLSYKGFDGTVTTLPTKSPANVCGTTFTTLPGNSPPPTSGVPSYMGVVVASSVSKSGNAINGNWAKIVVVKTDAGYSPSPGHPGTGTIVATFCG